MNNFDEEFATLFAQLNDENRAKVATVVDALYSGDYDTANAILAAHGLPPCRKGTDT